MRLQLQLITAMLLCTTAAAQAPKQDPDQPVASSGMTITVSTQLVQVDVVVHDANGRAVHGLKPSDFQLAEDKKTQTLRNFEEHVAVDPQHAKPPAVVKLGPGVFTDYSPVPEDAPLTVILVDRLNTPYFGQADLLRQLRKFVESADPNSRVAIFGLSSRLIMLQGFTSDPAVLRAAIGYKVGTRSSNTQPDSSDLETLSEAASEVGGSASISAGYKQFEAETASNMQSLGINLTLTAFNQLAGYLSGFPGRKNLLWLSGSFPITIDADPSIKYSFNTEANFSDAFTQMTARLAYARVAVYPIDVNGLEVNPIFSPGQDAANARHQTMNNLANDTGGQAFYNSNDLVGAFAQSLAAGSEYYTLTYTPTNHDVHGGFRTIHVQLEGPASSRDLKMFYRRGYYLEDPHNGTKPAKSLTAKADPAAKSAGPAPDAYALAVMQHGAPAPSDILFKVRVLPSAKPSEGRKVLPGPAGAVSYYDVNFTTLIHKIDMPLQGNGHHQGAVEFATIVYDGEGKVLNSESYTMHFSLTSENYDKLLKGGVAYSQQVNAPAKARSLRIAVHDLVSGRLGVVEVPLASVSKLAPAS